jgi:hypothetical protein
MKSLNEGKSMREVYDSNGKAIAGFDVIEVLPNGHEVKKAQFGPLCEDLADQTARDLDKEFGGFGTYYFVRVRRHT